MHRSRHRLPGSPVSGPLRWISPFAAILGLSAAAPAADWPQWRGEQRDGVWREDGLVEQFPSEKMPAVWTAPVAAGYSGPTVAEGRVYVPDKVSEPEEQERIHCFDAATGKALWTHAYPCPYEGVDYGYGPRASVTITGGRAYFLGAMGHALCLDAATGAVLWQRDLRADYAIDIPMWGLSSSPLVAGDIVLLQIGGGEGACVVGLDAASGLERWKAVEDRASYTSPILIRQAGRDVAVCSTANQVAGLDPATGAVLWNVPNKRVRLIDNVPTPVHDPATGRLFLTSFYNGSLMLHARPDALAAEVLWERRGSSERRTEALHAMISTPVLAGDRIYGIDSYGELRCLDAANGDRLWESQKAIPHGRWSTLHLVQNGERTWLFTEEGDLILARLSSDGYEELSRTRILEPTTPLAQRPSGSVCWAHPAFANRRLFARNDREIVCVDLAAPAKQP